MKPSFSKLRVLVLYANYTQTLSYFNDWQEALCEDPDIRTEAFDLCDRRNLTRLKRTVAGYDGIILLHSAMGDNLAFIRPYLDLLNRRKGRLLSFIGNEVNLPGISIRQKLELLQRLRPEFIATQLPLSSGQYLYGDLHGTRVVAVPHALNPKRFKPVIPQSERLIDIGIRSYRYLPCLGDNERNQIMDFFGTHTFEPELNVDMDTRHSARLDPEQWAAFLNQCKGTVSTEAGSGYLEKDDHTVRAILTWMKSRRGWKQTLYDALRHPALRKLAPAGARVRLRQLMAQSPAERQYQALITMQNQEELSFSSIYERFFRGYPNPVSGKCISSRHFDAIGTGTCQIMFPGEFNGILKKDVHYLSLNPEFSNIREVMERFHDVSFREKMAHNTLEYVMNQHTYRHRVQDIKNILAYE